MILCLCVYIHMCVDMCMSLDTQERLGDVYGSFSKHAHTCVPICVIIVRNVGERSADEYLLLPD